MSKPNTTTATATTEVQETKKFHIIEGIITSARFGKSRFNDEDKNRLTVKSDSIPYDDIHAYDKAGERLTPKWYKEQNGYINLVSRYDIPVRSTKGRQITFEEWLEEFNTIGAKVKVKINEKDGAVYPMAIVVLEDGEDLNPFEGL